MVSAVMREAARKNSNSGKLSSEDEPWLLGREAWGWLVWGDLTDLFPVHGGPQAPPPLGPRKAAETTQAPPLFIHSPFPTKEGRRF